MGIKISSINLNEFAQSVSSECKQQFLPSPYDDLILPTLWIIAHAPSLLILPRGLQQTSTPILTTQLPNSSAS